MGTYSSCTVPSSLGVRGAAAFCVCKAYKRSTNREHTCTHTHPPTLVHTHAARNGFGYINQKCSFFVSPRRAIHYRTAFYRRNPAAYLFRLAWLLFSCAPFGDCLQAPFLLPGRVLCSIITEKTKLYHLSDATVLQLYLLATLRDEREGGALPRRTVLFIEFIDTYA